MSIAQQLQQLVVELDGVPVPEPLKQGIADVRVQQRASLPSQCELLMIISPESETLGMGQFLDCTLSIRLRDTGVQLFDGYVVALEQEYTGRGAKLVRLRAYDTLYRLRERQPVRSHHQLTCTELATELVADLQIKVDTHADGPILARLMQHCQSDFELLADAARRSALLFTLRGKTLIFYTLKGIDETVQLQLGDSLIEARAQINTTGTSQSTCAFAWDPWLAEPVTGQTSSANSPHTAYCSTNNHSTERLTLTGKTIQSSEQADTLAQQNLDARTNNGSSIQGVARGNPALRPGATVQVDGLNADFESNYIVCNVTHTINRETGYLSTFDSQLGDTLSATARVAGTTLGLVTDNNDPSGLARVRVSLPAYANLETEWLQVALPAAGADKGMMLLPDVDDKVLVQLIDNDISQAVIVGNLYGQKTPPDSGIENGKARLYTIRSSGGQKIQLDDIENALRLETAKNSDLHLLPGRARFQNGSGCYVQLKGKTTVIHAAGDLVLEAPGGQVTIRGKAIDFEQG